jgi:hypothetical protein
MKTRKPVRLQGYDYSREGVYFVTICSKDRECIFGYPGVGALLACARTEEIELTQIGQIIEKQWNDIPAQQSWIRALDSKFKICSKKLTNFGICYKALINSKPLISMNLL